MKKKYPNTTGYYCYCHITPDEMFYIGMSKQQPSQRWRPSKYKTKYLGLYIKKYGWDNIKHLILKDGLSKEQAEQLEGLLIQEAKRQGFCINKNGSGGKSRDNKREWRREYEQRPEVKQRIRDYQREYKREYQKTEKWKEYHREYQRQNRLK